MSGSAGHENLFIIGCPRSGTTWLQLLLGYHPAVSTANETQLVSDYLGPPLRRWMSSSRSRRDTGLQQLFEHEEFVARLRAVARETMTRIADDGSEVVLEKTPQHALWGPELLEIFPDARIIHLVRDPRDVTASLLAASEDWGSGWAPDNAHDAAWWWRDHVEAVCEFRTRTHRFREARYEDLYAEPEDCLADLFDWLGLDASARLCAEAVRETRISRLRDGSAEAPWDLGSEPEDFFRKGGSGNWREDLSRGQARIVEHVCREGMEEHGYPFPTRFQVPPLALLPYWLRDRIRGWLC